LGSISSGFERTLGAGATETRDAAIAAPVQWLIASMAAGAGIIHLVMVPSHMDEWAVEGAGFALAGLLQMLLAAVVLTRPSRALLLSSIALNAGLVGAWALSRSSGLPGGPHAWHAEDASFIDVTCVAFEAGMIALAGIANVRRSFARGADRYLAGALSLALLVIATAAVASPSARDHAAGSHGAHGDAAHDDLGFSLLSNGHHHEITVQQLDPATQAALDAQLAVTREVALTYPTVKDAEAAGFGRVGPYVPGLGVHYAKYTAAAFNPAGVMDDEALRNPLVIIYEGSDPTSRVAGFMYYSASQTEPEGFAGPNDVWHYHERLCLKFADGKIDAPYGLDNQATDEQCARAGGSMIEQTAWMVHVWSVPGYDDIQAGTFAEHNPDLRCKDGTYYVLPADQWAANPLNACVAQ